MSPTALRDFVTAAAGWRRRGIAFAAGALSVLALAPFFIWPILFVTLPVLVWLIDGARETQETRGWRRLARSRLMRAAGAGWWFGFGYFLLGLFWIGEAFLVEADKFAWLLPFAVTLMPAGLSLFYAVATAATATFSRPGLERVFALAVMLSSAEWLRGHVLTGFPWNVLGYALTWPVELMQGAAVIGIYGLTLWAVLIFAGPAVVAADLPVRSGRALLGPLAIALVPLAALAAYGTLLVHGAPPTRQGGAHVRIVQPSVPQREKWLPQNQRAIFDLHLDLSRRNAAGAVDDLAGVDRLVWPEAAMPFLPLERPEVLAELRTLLAGRSILVTGALRRQQGPDGTIGGAPTAQYFNSLMVIGGPEAPIRVYDKIHLVPFGEYLPAQGVLEAIGLEQLTRLRGGFTAGPEPRPLLDGIGPLICYEAIFPGTLVAGATRPEVFVNVTNDGWFGNTTGPRQHFHQARVRAVEEGIPIIRAANNGISALIDADGRVLAELGMNVRGVLDVTLPGSKAPPPYARWGDALFAINLLLFLGLMGYVRRRSVTAAG